MKKKLITAALAVMLALSAVSAAFAYYRSASKPSANIITTGKVSAQLTVDALDRLPTKIEVLNNGTVDEYIRIKVIANEIDASGQKTAVDPSLYVNYDDSKWIKHTDGMYYLKVSLSPNVTAELLKQAAAAPAASNAKNVELIIQAQAVQRKNNTDSPTTAEGWPAFPVPSV